MPYRPIIIWKRFMQGVGLRTVEEFKAGVQLEHDVGDVWNGHNRLFRVENGM